MCMSHTLASFSASDGNFSCSGQKCFSQKRFRFKSISKNLSHHHLLNSLPAFHFKTQRLDFPNKHWNKMFLLLSSKIRWDIKIKIQPWHQSDSFWFNLIPKYGEKLNVQMIFQVEDPPCWHALCMERNEMPSILDMYTYTCRYDQIWNSQFQTVIWSRFSWQGVLCSLFVCRCE